MIDDSVTTKQTWPGGSDGSDRTGNKSIKKYNYNNKTLLRRSTNLTATSGIYSSDGSDSEGITTNIWSRLLSRSTSSASDYKNKSYRDDGEESRIHSVGVLHVLQSGKSREVVLRGGKDCVGILPDSGA